ncbi:MAG: adenine phosphoribosyltransferase [Actinomycetes bacterium]
MSSGPAAVRRDQEGAAGLARSLVRDVPDFPVPGVMFKDITPVLRDPVAFPAVVDALHAAMPDEVDVVAGIEARGFIIGAPLAVRARAGFVPIRKSGKLPAQTLHAGYDLEYGQAEIEVHADAFAARDSVVVVDDLLATGGTAAAACDLVERAGARVAAVLFLLELGFLHGRTRMPGRDVFALVTL